MKLYFSELNDGLCETISSIKEEMKEQGIAEMDVFEAKIEYGNGYFYCREFGDIGEVGEGCGKMCDKYSPRNGKNGRCRFSGHTYEQTEIKRTIKL
jgi:hypothetical protein